MSLQLSKILIGFGSLKPRFSVYSLSGHYSAAHTKLVITDCAFVPECTRDCYLCTSRAFRPVPDLIYESIDAAMQDSLHRRKIFTGYLLFLFVGPKPPVSYGFMFHTSYLIQHTFVVIPRRDSFFMHFFYFLQKISTKSLVNSTGVLRSSEHVPVILRLYGRTLWVFKTVYQISH